MVNVTLYERDFYAWTKKQAALLRAGRLDQVDIEHIAEELGRLGQREKRDLIRRLDIVLTHWLRWHFQPRLHTRAWQLSIANARDALDERLEDNPSLKRELPASIACAYRDACRNAQAQTGLAETVFPVHCPYRWEQIRDPAFWPESR